MDCIDPSCRNLRKEREKEKVDVDSQLYGFIERKGLIDARHCWKRLKDRMTDSRYADRWI